MAGQKKSRQNKTPRIIDKDSIMNQFSSVIENSIATTFAPIDAPDDDTIPSAPSYCKSEFLTPDEIADYLKSHKNNFTSFIIIIKFLTASLDTSYLLRKRLLLKREDF